MSVNEVFLRVLLSVTSGYSVNFTMAFDCSFDLFDVERTNIDTLSCNLGYSMISVQVSLFSMLSVAPESIRKSISRCGGEIVFL